MLTDGSFSQDVLVPGGGSVHPMSSEVLEKEMQYMVDTYKCEWKDVVEDPAKRKRFTHFINSPMADPTIKFQAMRDQKKPVEWGA